MEANFWLDRWKENQIGFHLPQANPNLVKHYQSLRLKTDSRVFVPLCGKTLDIAWLLAQGQRVVGAELSELAITQLFEELKVTPSITNVGPLKLYKAPALEIFVGDIFLLTPETLGPIDAIYDRAALVALPSEMRSRYTKHLRSLSSHASQLLVTFEYDQNIMPGPPFSVSSQEVLTHYPEAKCLSSEDIPNGLRGQFPAKESVWLIH